MLEHIFQRLRREREIPLAALVRKCVKYVSARAAAPWRLRACTRVGRGIRAVGALRIVNRGVINIGDGAILLSEFGPIELEAEPGGRIDVGAGVGINYGARVHAARQILIEDGACVSPHCIIRDVDRSSTAAEPRPIFIGANAWLASGVTVLPGAHIGAGATIVAGSVVAGAIPPGSVAGGVPARVLRIRAERERPSKDGESG